MNQIGPYQIISELGRGGMAVVYRALQPSVNRIVALKVLPTHLERDEESLHRFRREAETAANLSHEHIVKVWDASVTDPPYYIAMEFLDGGTLAERLAGGPLAVKQATEIARSVCEALHHAHQRGVVHRDIKPANIMFDSTGRPVVTDFGIARTTERSQLTAPGLKFGTPNYMSPEQASGLPTDGRTDIWSAGAVLYEMVTGRPPFGSDDPLAVMYRIVNEQPVLPSSLNPGVPRALDAVVLRALEKDPRHRYQTGGEMAAALAAAMRPVAEMAPTVVSLPATPGAAATASGPARGRRRWALAVGAGLALLAVGAGGTAYLSASGIFSHPRITQREEADPAPPAGRPGTETEQPTLASGEPAPAGEESPADIARASAPEGQPGQPAGGPRGQDSPVGPSAQAAEPAPPSPVKVPNVTGRPSGEARAALAQAGFVCLTETRPDQSAAKGLVISQQPAAGSVQPPGSTVRLVISSGAPSPARQARSQTGRRHPRTTGSPASPRTPPAPPPLPP